jgi:NADH-quinone oxidoreductase subunit N
MSFNLLPITPEIFLLTTACIILLVDAYLSDESRDLSYQLVQGTLLGTMSLLWLTFPTQKTFILSSLVVIDPMGALLKLFIVATVFIVFVYSRNYLKARNFFKGEYFVLGLLATLGMMTMVSAHNLLIIYLGLELLSLSLYAMVAMHRDSSQATEAAMKYFILGAIASGMLLYGMSILYGVTGSLDLGIIAQKTAQLDGNKTFFAFGLVFLMVGLAFKFGAVPFHMWVPDVYQGAPTSVTMFISTAPKLAAFAMLMRLLIEGLPAMQAEWQQMLVILSVLSMAVGNIIAIVQSNIKRMLAYSTISHVGFLLLGVLTATQTGYAAAMFYTIVYALMGLGGFGMIILLSRAGFEAENVVDFKGLNERSPWYAFIMLILMLSMAGVPPMLGFWAKLSVLMEAVHTGYLWLALVGVLLSVIGAYYYLRIIWMMYFEKPLDNEPIVTTPDMQVALSANGLIILGLGMFPQALMVLCSGAIG